MITANETAAELALDFTRAGFSIVPLRCDGSKMTTLHSWKPYQSRIADDATVRDWFDIYPNAGTAIVCGAVSGGLEVLDFDQDAERVYPAWHSLVESIAIRLPIVETPSCGLHVYYRCNVICGSTKIAMPAKESKSDLRTIVHKNPLSSPNQKPFIESRGQGSYVSLLKLSRFRGIRVLSLLSLF